MNESLKFRTPHVKNGFTVVLSKKAIGNENGLGEKLLEDFIYSLSNSFELPQNLIFMNEAVFLLDNENVVITPHNAFNSIEAVNRIINTTIGNINLI